MMKKMRSLLSKFLLPVILAALMIPLSNTLAYRAEVFVIHVSDTGFSPSEIKIKREQVIVFENTGSENHWPILKPGDKKMSSEGPLKSLKPNERWGFSFVQSGSWHAEDRLNPQITGNIQIDEFDGFTPYRPNQLLAERNTWTTASVGQWIKSLWYWIIKYKADDSVESELNINESSITTNDETLAKYIEKFGGGQSVRRLEELLPPKDCHKRTHVVGKYAYDNFGADAFQWHAFATVSECNSGFFHGLLETFLKSNTEHRVLGSPIEEYGADNILKILRGVCDESAFDLKCAHVLGHSIMAWSNYQLYEALDICDNASQKPLIQEECWRGVFMENVDGGRNADIGHHTEYLSLENFLYPCDAVADKYKPACYQFAPGQIESIFIKDPQKAALACATIPSPFESTCFASIGLTAIMKNIDNLNEVKKICAYAPLEKQNMMCILGSANEAGFDYLKRPLVFKLCSLFEGIEQNTCYNAAFSAAKYGISSPAKYKDFCSLATGPIKESCLNFTEPNYEFNQLFR
jgi:hypothetical protein